jgi:hypothetical protein
MFRKASDIGKNLFVVQKEKAVKQQSIYMIQKKLSTGKRILLKTKKFLISKKYPPGGACIAAFFCISFLQ